MPEWAAVRGLDKNGNGTRGRNALTDGDPGISLGTGSVQPPGNWGWITGEGRQSQARKGLALKIRPIARQNNARGDSQRHSRRRAVPPQHAGMGYHRA